MIGIITPFLDGKPYHSKYSGYERLIKYLPKQKIYFTQNYKKISFLFYPFRVLKILPKMYATFKAELECLKENDIIFHLYGDTTFFLSGFKLFRKNKKILITLHEHENKFQKVMPFYWKFLLKDIDIIVVSPSQKRFFLKHLPKNKVHLIAHGVDVHYFKPNNKIKKKKQIIAVGNYFRDYNTLLQAMEVVNKRIKDLKLIVVARQVQNRYDANYEFKIGIPDSELLRLYQESLFQVLPLTGVTANNALLEGCACGLPLISIDSEDVKFYFNNVITYKDYKDLALRIINLYNNPDQVKVDINHLSWENIIKEIRLLLHEKENS